MANSTSPKPEGEDWGDGREIVPSKNVQWGERYFEDIAVLTATIDGVLHYEAHGLCRITAHSNSRKAVKDLVEPHQVKDLDISAAQRTVTWVTVGPNPIRKFVTREGANRLVLDSRVRGAQKVKHWLADDVMTSIEDTGGYGAPATTTLALPDLSVLDPQTLALLGQVGQALSQTSQALMAEKAITANQAKALDLAQSKADYVDAFVDGRQDVTSFRVYCNRSRSRSGSSGSTSLTRA
jgi:prophage antirepressor-like protein